MYCIKGNDKVFGELQLATGLKLIEWWIFLQLFHQDSHKYGFLDCIEKIDIGGRKLFSVFEYFRRILCYKMCLILLQFFFILYFEGRRYLVKQNNKASHKERKKKFEKG